MTKSVVTYSRKMWTKLLCLLVCGGVALAQTETKTVQVEQGTLRGYKDAQGEIFTFMNVPYATAPTGTNKFKAPLPPVNWTETFDAVNRKIVCQQSSLIIGEAYVIQEDCLVANIYVPDTNTTNLPVLVNVHGGAYVLGFGTILEYTSLVRTKEVIVVTFNYRLGVPGFLCLGTEDVPGNAGMKDQVALLRWVSRNIASFGGNPDDVTINGCSAGGSSVDFLTISPMSTGLFKKAILESGAVFGATATQVNPIENAKTYAKRLNFTNVDDLSALEEFYKTASNEFLASEMDIVMNSYNNLIKFAPCIERTTGEESFLSDIPENILKTGNYNKVPLLNGFAEMEGLYRLPAFNDFKDRMNAKFSDFLPGELQFANESQKEEVAARVKEFYFGNEDVSEDTVLAFVDYFTDIMFGYSMVRAANMRRESLGDTIYLYEYNFVDENTPLILNTNVGGPNHCYQANAVADEDVTNATEEYKSMKLYMRELWLNFIKTGNPTPAGSPLIWPSVSGTASPFMSLNETSRVEYSTLLGARAQLWDSIYDAHYAAPSPPSSATTLTMSLMLMTTIIVFNYILLSTF